MQQPINFTTPVGRLVAGNVYVPNETDAEGNPLVFKDGPNKGQPRKEWYFAVAIPKGPEVQLAQQYAAQGQNYPAWALTEWGRQVYQTGVTAYPMAGQGADFSWKIADGDSQKPNSKGKKPCERQGWAGHWVIHCSAGYPVNVYQARPGTTDDFVPFSVEGAVKLGHFVQVNINCKSNGSTQQPGVYLNHRMLAFIAYGTEIVVGPDVAAAGFGGAAMNALPAGATMQPPPGAFAAAAATPGMLPPPAHGAPAAMPGMPPAMPPPGYAAPPPAAAPVYAAPPPAAPAPAYAAPPPVAVAPHPGFVQMAAAPGMPPAAPGYAAPPPMPAVPPAAPAPRAIVMLPAAQGRTYEMFRQAGWDDAAIIGQGMGAYV